MDKAKTIRESLIMQQVAEFYGLQIDRKGFVKCPFHADKTASLKIYQHNKGFSCFGCNESGSVIDFVIKLFNISFSQAIIRLSNDFNLNLVRQKADIRQIKKLKQQTLLRKKHEFVKKLVYEYQYLEYKISDKIKQTIKHDIDITDEQKDAIIRNANAEIWLLNNL